MADFSHALPDYRSQITTQKSAQKLTNWSIYVTLLFTQTSGCHMKYITLKVPYYNEALSEEIKQKSPAIRRKMGIEDGSFQTSKYENSTSRERYAVNFDSEGRLCNQQGNAINGERLLYVMSRDKVLYVAPADQVKHHSYFTAGCEVVCSGMITVKNGELTMISNESGHYKPDFHALRQIAHILGENADISKTEFHDHTQCSKPNLKIKVFKMCGVQYSDHLHINVLKPVNEMKLVHTSRSNGKGLTPHLSKDFKKAIEVIKNGTKDRFATPETLLAAYKFTSHVAHKDVITQFLKESSAMRDRENADLMANGYDVTLDDEDMRLVF